MERNSLKLLEKIDATRLPPLPQVLLRLVELCDNQDVEVSEISSTIAGDGALAARIMGVAGSAAYRSSARINTLDRALALIGTDMVKTLAVSAAVHQVFSGFSPLGLDHRHFWRHSLLTAQLGRRLAERVGEPYPGEAYLAGLVHDVGQMLLAANFPEDYGPVLDANLAGETLCEAEQAALGVTHAEVGAWLIRGWHLDDFLADAVAYHHEPVMQLPGSHPLVQIVHLANRLAQDQPGEELPNTFRLGEDELMEMRGKAAVEVLQVARALGIDIEPAADPEETAAPAGTVPFPEERRRNRPALAERAESAAGPETVRVERRSHRGGMPPLVSAPESLGMDREAAAKLVERVRNHADISSLRHCFSQVRDAAEAMSAVRECLQMLFGATQVQFYLLDGEAKALRNMGNGRDEPVRFSVPADATASVLIKSLKTHTLLPLFRADASSVVDKQVIQMLGDEAMLCVPLNTGERRIGVMAVGGGQPLVKRLLERRPLLLLFAREAAMALDIGAPVQRPAPEAEEHMLLARKVAHEVNSPLAIMKNYLSVLGTRLPPDNPAKQDLRIIDQEIDRVSSIIRRLVQTDEVEAEGMADANTTLTDLLKLVGPGLLKENGIEVRTRLSEMPAIRTDARKLRQVLLNLIRNAAEAMPHGGRLTVSTRDRVAVDDRSCIQISIEDTGPGIPPEVMDRLFKPVKTSKGEGHAGLGLSIVGSLVKELRGSVRCESGKQGTRFHILLPRETAGT